VSKKRYKAYKPIPVTDGIRRWTSNTFTLDNTVAWTQDDIEKFKSGFATLSPDARIAHLQTCLDNLGDARSQAHLDNLEKRTPEIRPAIKVHADVIQAILSGLNNYSIPDGDRFSELLALAEKYWRNILILCEVMPKAAQGAAQSERQSEKARRPRNISYHESVKSLAKKYPDARPRDVWDKLPGELENNDCEIEEYGDEYYRYVENIRYTGDGDNKPVKTKPVKFRSFSNLFYKSRKEIKKGK
jgi:hypothetical protein